MFCPIKKKSTQPSVTAHPADKKYERLPCHLCGTRHTEFYDETHREIDEHGIKASINTWAIPFPYYFTDHTQMHANRLLSYMDQLVRPLQMNQSVAISAEEMLVLSLSAYLHDINMQTIGEELENEFEDIWNERGNAFFIRYEDLLARVRKTHASRLDDDINKIFQRFKRSPVISAEAKKLLGQICEPVKIVCRYHTGTRDHMETLADIKDSYPVGNTSISRERLLMLVGLFRIADKLDLTEDRINEAVLRHLPMPENSVLTLWKLSIIKNITVDEFQKVRIEYQDNSRFTTNVMKTVYDRLFKEIDLVESLDLLRNGSNGVLAIRKEKKIAETPDKKEWPAEVKPDQYALLTEQLDRERLDQGRMEQLYFNYQFEPEPVSGTLSPLQSYEEEAERILAEKKISVDLVNADLHYLLRLLEKELRAKLVIQPRIVRTVTLKVADVAAATLLERVVRENYLADFVIDDIVYVGERLWVDRVRKRFRLFMEDETDKRTLMAIFGMLPVQETTLFFKTMYITQSISAVSLAWLKNVMTDLAFHQENLVSPELKSNFCEFLNLLRSLGDDCEKFVITHFDTADNYFFGQPRVKDETYHADLDDLNVLVVKTQYCFEQVIHQAYRRFPELFYTS